MTKFEEEVKRPDNGPITELNNSMQSVLSQYRKMREYATQLEDDSKQKDEHILKLENENSFMRDERTTFDSNGNSVEPIIPQQALPVVPECVAEWIERLKTNDLKPLKNPETYGETGFTEEKLQNIVFWISENQEDYMRAWLDGYTVEKSDKCMVKLGALYFKCWNDVDAVFIIDDQPGAYESAFVFKKREDAEKVAQLVGGRVVKN